MTDRLVSHLRYAALAVPDFERERDFFVQHWGLTEVHAMVHPGNASMIRIMSAIGRRLHREYDGGTLTLIAHLDHRGERHTQRLPSHM